MTKGNPRQHWLKALIASVSEGNLSDFAEKTRMDYTGLNLMVNGKRPISEKTVIKIANRLKVEPPKGMDVPLPKRQETANAPGEVSVKADDLSELASEMRLMRHLLNAVLDRLPPKP